MQAGDCAIDVGITLLPGSATTPIKLTWSVISFRKNFDAHQAARTAEMDALREAKAILSGMK